MAFVGIEFQGDCGEGGTIALIHCSWLTPLKDQVWWPPYKTSAQFKKALITKEEVKENELNKANKKLKECEEFSDLQSTELEDEIQNKKRKRKPNSKYTNIDTHTLSSEDEDQENLQSPSILYKPIQLIKDRYFKTLSRQNNVVEKVSILISRKHINTFGVSFARNCLLTFIKHGKNELYGSEFAIYNVHLLAHICDDVEIYGSLDEYSAFPFENYLGRLKKYIKSSINPLQQIYRRLQESNPVLLELNERKLENFDNVKYFVNIEHTDGPLVNNFCEWHKQYKKIIFANMVFTVNQYSMSNSYCSLNDNKIVEIHNIIKTTKGDVYLIGKHFIEYSSLYFYPCDSSLLNIYIVKGLSEFKIWPVNLIDSKCILLPYINNDNCYVCLPIIHSLY